MTATASGPLAEVGVTETTLLELGRGLHEAGAPAYRIEDALAGLARRQGLEAQFFSTPTSLFAAFGSGVEQRTHLLRFEPGGIDLGRMGDLDALLEEAARPGTDAALVRERLDAVRTAPIRFGPWLSAAAFGVASAAAAVFFRGSPADALVAGVLAVGVGGLHRLLAGSVERRRLFEPLAAALSALGALVAAHLVPGVAPWTATLAGVIVLVPGLSLTVGLGEIARSHWVAGAGRLAGAAATFMLLGLGLALGGRAGHWLLGAGLAERPPTHADSLSLASFGPAAAAAELVALLLAPLAFAVLFRVRRRDLPFVLLGGVLSYLAARTGARAAGPEWGAFLGAAALGLLGNLFALGLRRPAQVVLVPGLLLLVPGSFGVHSVRAFLAEDALAGLQEAFRMMAIGGALVGGLFLAQALIPPRRSL